MTYLLFLRLLRWLFLTTTITVALPLTVANYYINTRTESGSVLADKPNNDTSPSITGTSLSKEDAGEMAQSLLDNLLIFTAANVKGNGLWVHIGFEYAVTGIVILFGEPLTQVTWTGWC